MGNKMYVGNLSFLVTENQLIDLFSKFGTVNSAKIIMDRETGRSKGFAFIEMSTNHETSKAIEGLDGFELDDRKLKVNEARPQKSRGNYGGFGDFRRGGDRY